MGKSFKTFDLFKLSSPVKSSRSPARLQILITMMSTALSLAAFLLLANVAYAFVVPGTGEAELEEMRLRGSSCLDDCKKMFKNSKINLRSCRIDCMQEFDDFQ